MSAAAAAPVYGLCKPTVKVAALNSMIPRRPSYHGLNPKEPKMPSLKHNNSNNRVSDVLRLLDSMHFPIPTDMYASLLKECTDSKDIVGGADLHAHINNNLSTSGITRRLRLANRLLLMYASCGHLDSARQLFEKMTSRDSVSWLIMITSHVDQNFPEEALRLFNQMIMETSVQHQDLKLSVPSVLKACVNTGHFGLGKQVHGLVLKLGHTEGDLIMCSSLIDFYGKFRCLDGSQRVFDQVIPSRGDTVTWTSMMAAYCKQGHFDMVIELFKKMGRAGVKKNSFTISTVLRACGRLSRGAEDCESNDDRGMCGKQVHANAIKLGVVESDIYVQCSLVDMYGKCGLIKESRMAFNWITGSSERNDVCWSAMLNTYMQHGSYKEAIKLLYLMNSVGIELPESVLNSLRVACAGI
ncbi:hypothetical protein MKW94_021958 [Papaver nudicaule]|uniref:Pentatricopeptide repeat-containing protein n=1 Tax=Papaver nudicaule TaxID=74823 RepID=A0AA41VGG2_PAPNU|nr:hypothetical protein [Papaver nudicaule]